MKYTNISKDELILLAEDSFKKKNYSKCYSVCSELLKQKAPSVVVYMHSICSLHVARSNDEYLDRQIENTLLVLTALDKFYTNSAVKNDKINFYVLDILHTLLLLNVDCAIYTFKSNKQLRSKKKLENSLLLSKQNLATLENFNFDAFELVFPRSIIDLRNIAVDQILEFIDISISGSWQTVDEYRLKLTDTYEQIANFGKELKTIGIDGILQKQQEQIEYELQRQEQEQYASLQANTYDEQSDDVDDYYIYDSLKEKNRKNIITKVDDKADFEDSDESENLDDPLETLKHDLEIFDDLKEESKEPLVPKADRSEIEKLENEISDIQALLNQETAEKSIEPLQNLDNEISEEITYSEQETSTDEFSEEKISAVDFKEETNSDDDFLQEGTSDNTITKDIEFDIDDSDIEISVSDELSLDDKQKLKKKKALIIDISIVVVSTIITLLVLTLIMMQFKPDFVQWFIDTIFN